MSETNGIGHHAKPHPSPCAACMVQRRKCGPNCPLAPFFPQDSIVDFFNARRLFGMKGIIKILQNLSPDQKKEAVRSLIYEGNARAADPVGGSTRVICRLRQQIEDCGRELDYVMCQLANCGAIADPSSFHQSEYGVDSQDSFPSPFIFQGDYQAFQDKCSEKESESLMRLAQYPPPSISQHGGDWDFIAEGQITQPEIKEEEQLAHLLPHNW